MAKVAKLLGILCMGGAVWEVLLGIALLVTAEESTSSTEFGPSTSSDFSGVSVLILGLFVLAFLLLVTVGAAAYVVGEMSERQEAEHRRRAINQPRPGEYGASLRSQLP